MSESQGATDFFERQDRARRKTGVLILLFAIAVLLLSVGTYIALGFLMNPDAVAFVTEPGAEFHLDVELAVVALVCTGAFIFIGSAWKTSALSEGGATVAEAIGGEEVDASSGDPLVRRYVNVVEEMALASGVPVPRIYVLEDEPGINAFAAGYTMNDAAVAVTRGALEQLTRDELQGVVAHEFSHILNGDMRLNIRLIGIIHGILLIYVTGRILLRTLGRGGGRGRGAAPLVAGGLVLMLAGLGGVICGRLIKAAVSRQREYLADSAAVQFTRNPQGLAGALKKIGGYTHGSNIKSANAEEVSHMCFGSVSEGGMISKLTGGLTSTHPSLEKRIKAIDPSFAPEGEFEKLDAGTQRAKLTSETSAAAGAKGLAAAAGAKATGGDRSAGGNEWSASDRRLDYDMRADDVVGTVGQTSPQRLVYCATLLDEIPRSLMEARSNVLGATAIVYALLLDKDRNERRKQGEMLERFAEASVVHETRELWPAIARLDPEFRLPLMDLLVPTLRRMTEQQYREFAVTVDRLIQADNRVSFKEFVLEKVLLHRLELAFHETNRRAIRHRTFSKVRSDVQRVMSCLAFVGHDHLNVAQMAFDEGVDRLEKAFGERIELLERGEWTFEAVGESLERLSLANPKIKKAVIDACAYCVMGDDEVVLEEVEMLRATCEVLDVPLPPFIPRATRRDAG